MVECVTILGTNIVMNHKIVFTRDSRKYPNKYFLKDESNLIMSNLRLKWLHIPP